jgi:hypothetical protein
MKALAYPLLFITILLAAACGSDQADKNGSAEKGKITNLYVRYMERENKVKAIAEFKAADEQGKPAADSAAYKVWFQGRAMQNLSEFTGKNYYDLELDHAQPGVFEFTIEDSKGQVAAHALELTMPGPLSVEGFKKGSGLMVNLNKLTLKEGDDLIAVITDKGSQSVSSLIKGPSAGKVLITQEAFDAMEEGPCSIYFVWKTAEQKTLENGRLLIQEREYFFEEIVHELIK